MATTTSGLMQFEYKIPSEPCPMPSLGSEDEESFVVLGKSLTPELDLSIDHIPEEPIQSGPLEEAKRLINMELSQLSHSVLPEMPDVSENIRNHNNSLNTISITTISTELTPEEVQAKVEILIEENIQLKNTILQNNMAMKSQYDRIVAWQADVQKTYQAHKQKFTEAKQFITKLKGANASLTLEVEKCNEIRKLQDEEIMRLKGDVKNVEVLNKSVNGNNSFIEDDELKVTQDKVKELEAALNNLSISCERILIENESLKNIPDYSQRVVMLEKELVEKGEVIQDIQNELENKKIQASEVERNLNTEIINLKSHLCMNDHIKEDLENLRKQLMSSQSTLTGLQQTNKVLNAQLDVEKSKVKELKVLELLKDDYAALQAQTDIYKTDFESEREAKERIKAEKDQITQDFLQIQKRNNELNEELELVRERGFEVVQPSSVPRGAPSIEGRFNCPVCSFGFTTLQAVENHIDRCLAMQSALP